MVVITTAGLGTFECSESSAYCLFPGMHDMNGILYFLDGFRYPERGGT